ncbi:carnitine dehydratase [Citromicrobium sp. RCC1885]|uniref:CaiB/BaiF CoA transferase family protein n=1 Tax=unclassified Citromicrobium TaxID=2630544 RepID=UPI0006C90715|nr:MULTISPECIES: CaiB/BaiF CoA-transferase family protein [unclassified Citromicrobium]KPM21760.1 carnitine dehydratase [Citromicrobium sp. RCC1885]KPM23609.1 carnitine dehydratase [Citromicrobium sp. RCC1878]OAM06820.1 carnitine dehydratase [Citromicrobium sp. RCC1897]|tara:strand:- start:307 stop:1455 length:1149 start_codon:yes stop_codon:yes gene_type:complete
MAGPLAGLRIVEFAGIGPGPFCGMMLADHGAEVIRIDRASGGRGGSQPISNKDILARGRKSIALNLKDEQGIALARKLCASADGLIEGFRPGVMERLGLGPNVILADNPKLVYGRMTGWGQTGPYAPYAGHDINYIALAGALAHFGRAGEKPTPPINMVGDFGGGGMMLAFGMVSALLNVARGGEGQVIDAAMTDGTAVLMGMIHGMANQGLWREETGTNLLDTGAHFYDTYETADGKFVSIGSIEPQFYAELRARLGLAEDPDFDAQMNPSQWPALKDKLAAIFRTKTRAEWDEALEHSDVCYAPVLTMSEAREHPHMAARETFIDVADSPQPAPAPRYSGTATATPSPAPMPGDDTSDILAQLGLSEGEIAEFRQCGAVS